MPSYGDNRLQLLQYITAKTKEPLILFLIRSNGWTPDFLAAAAAHQTERGRFLVLGISRPLPCWDESIVEVKSWTALMQEVEEWLKTMQEAAGNAVFTTVAEESSAPNFGEGELPSWIVWQPANFGFTFPSNQKMRFTIHHSPTPLTPTRLVEWCKKQTAIAEVRAHIKNQEREQQEAIQAVQKAKEWLDFVENELKKLNEELAQIENSQIPV